MAPKVSIIICSRNRAAQLGKCLDSIREDEMLATAAELVLIDNGSTDGTAQFLARQALGDRDCVAQLTQHLDGDGNLILDQQGQIDQWPSRIGNQAFPAYVRPGFLGQVWHHRGSQQ